MTDPSRYVANKAGNAANVRQFRGGSTRLESPGNSLSGIFNHMPAYFCDYRADIGDVFGKIQRYYASKSIRDWIASFRTFIAAMMQLTIDLGKEFQR
ncbi:MAG: hypothetical protein ABJB10_18620 [Mesorhizobium sp.]